MNTCQTCTETKPFNQGNRFCLLYGITVRNEHPACRYHAGEKKAEKRLDGTETVEHDVHRKTNH